MRTVSASFDTYDEVTAAVDGLSDMGVPGSDIAVVSQGPGPLAKIAGGAVLGAAIGGAAGLVAGFAIPGLGSLFSIGWFVPLMVGAAAGGVAGGVIGSLWRAGIDESGAQVHTEGVQRGTTLLVARVHDDEAGEARAILLKCGAIDTNSRRSEYAADGWDGFVAKDIWDEDIGSEDDRLHEDRTGRDMTGRNSFSHRHVA
jgi:hypothetical protein